MKKAWNISIKKIHCALPSTAVITQPMNSAFEYCDCLFHFYIYSIFAIDISLEMKIYVNFRVDFINAHIYAIEWKKGKLVPWGRIFIPNRSYIVTIKWKQPKLFRVPHKMRKQRRWKKQQQLRKLMTCIKRSFVFTSSKGLLHFY